MHPLAGKPATKELPLPQGIRRLHRDVHPPGIPLDKQGQDTPLPPRPWPRAHPDTAPPAGQKDDAARAARDARLIFK